MGKKPSRTKAAVSQQLHTPLVPAVITADTDNKPHSRATTVIEPSVATAIADVFRNNGISVGRNLAKILEIFWEIDEAKSRGVI
jgi:hypothetical protein